MLIDVRCITKSYMFSVADVQQSIRNTYFRPEADEAAIPNSVPPSLSVVRSKPMLVGYPRWWPRLEVATDLVRHEKPGNVVRIGNHQVVDLVALYG